METPQDHFRPSTPLPVSMQPQLDALKARYEELKNEERDDKAVVHPAHYNQYKGLEIIDLVEQMNFNRGNAVKYITRAGFKNPAKDIEDLEKAAFYLKREIERLKSAEPATKEADPVDDFIQDWGLYGATVFGIDINKPPYHCPECGICLDVDLSCPNNHGMLLLQVGGNAWVPWATKPKSKAYTFADYVASKECSKCHQKKLSVSSSNPKKVFCSNCSTTFCKTDVGWESTHA